MFSFLLGLFFAGLVINLFVRMMFKTTPRRMLYDSIVSPTHNTDYVKGYLVGITNIKMYYYVLGSIPPMDWLDNNKLHLLNNRDDLLKTVDEETKRGAGLLQ